jgi:uncharacterized protein (DUF2141 family)
MESAIMKRWISACATLVLAACMLLVSATSGAQDGLATVKVNISGLKGTEGVALITLYDSAESWLKVPKAIQVLRMKITGAAMTVEFKGVKPGTYAVSVVHDANKNNEMDMRWLPWPKHKEGSAASNDPEARLLRRPSRARPSGKPPSSTSPLKAHRSKPR